MRKQQQRSNTSNYVQSLQFNTKNINTERVMALLRYRVDLPES